MLDFRFSNTSNSRNKDSVADLLVQPRLWIPGGDYPAHMEWREKALEEITADKKRAMVAYWGNEAVGSVIYQQHPIHPSVVEVRNISVERHARGRHIASFLLAQTEHEARIDFPNTTSITTDTKQANSEILSFAIRNGYTIDAENVLDETSFAHNGEPDVVLTKYLPAINDYLPL